VAELYIPTLRKSETASRPHQDEAYVWRSPSPPLPFDLAVKMRCAGWQGHIHAHGSHWACCTTRTACHHRAARKNNPMKKNNPMNKNDPMQRMRLYGTLHDDLT
jgi:hypothetical protein